MVKKILLSLITLIGINTSNLMAAQLNPIIQLGYDFGGETLAEVQHYDAYNGYDINKVRAGQGVNLELGASMSNDANTLELKLLAGYKVDQKSAYNGSVRWERIPLSAVALLKNNRWKLGGGVTYHIDPRLVGNFSGIDNNNVPFNDHVDDLYENSVGAIVEVQYNITESTSIGLKGTLIEYSLKNNPSVVADGNSVGINLAYTFGKESAFR